MKKKKKAFCFCWSLQNKYNTKKCHFLLAETMGGGKTTPTKISGQKTQKAEEIAET